MEVCNLSSGSKGNANFIRTTKYNILFDSGKTISYIDSKLKEIGSSVKDLDYVFITHTHKDHIAALKQVLNKSGAYLCIPKLMFKELDDLKDYTHVIFVETELELDDGTIITSFKSSHDATESRNFIVTSSEGAKVAYITDTGYLNNRYFKMLENLDLYFFEANHDIEMLENGPYPLWLKKRVVSDIGHLSNNACGFYLSKLIGPNTKDVLLIHLSETNNTPKRAIDTVRYILSEYDIDFKNITYAMQEERSKVYKI